MQPLGFEQLSEEAKNLISSHVPGVARDTHEGSSSRVYNEDNGSTANLINPDDYNSEPNTPTKEGFYAPNPEMFLRGENNPDFDQQDDFLLDEDTEDGYIAPPKQVHAGVLSSLLRLYQNPHDAKSAASLTSRSTDATTLAEESNFLESADTTRHSTMDFSKWKNELKKAPKKLTNKFPGHKKGAAITSDPDDEGSFDEKDAEGAHLPSFQNAKPKAPKKVNVNKVNLKKLKNHKNNKKADRLRITVHIADILQRQRFIMRMCRALMLFGAPTHRLEEYMIMTSRVLEIDGQFIYFPGCMIVSFGDAATRTSEVHLVRCAQGVNLSKLSDTHRIYKGVIHDLLGVEEAALKLEELLRKKNMYPPWLCVFLYGLGSAMVCPFAFGGGWVDLPIAFGVGLCVGYLQFIVSSISNLYSSVFEVTASIVVAFIARAIGSIHHGSIFCFSAIAQGSLALILPGYIILTGSLELQSRNLVAGSVRMFYAIIYSLFLGFGITLGGALYGWVDKNSVSANKCGDDHSMDDKWKILFVPMFSLSLGLINQARWQQLPVMIFISCVGYIGNYFAGKHFSTVTEFTACIGAFIIGVLGNLYSRIWKGMAVSAMLPAIFVQVPSGIASQSSLVSGIQAADQITKSNDSSADGNATVSSGSLSFGQTMVEVSIGISVGLFAAALVVYPLGKKRTGLFTL
ncbi:pheromone-regulated membrane [Suhomyces tanzawaensis NRRL Y-17324]|uniref:Pheromone-regulated membrane protein 10 n=1 Tax=Suhomyces tanzawaensis NRRL Y-17324 TaxID=984487 RepID=A0A1E4SIZ3_9ASCO|nr:pheromone-regulated membrane [Suhomyces tanzawaensis NRRL Y-17324]ODV79471.1 pheromone-regulated membrane [Suhomyces tanzawaensis NRRL Y-17324]